MKAILITLVLTLASCGYRNTLRRHCHLDTSGQTCDNLFGQDEWEKDSDNKRVVESLQSQIESLTLANEVLVESLSGMGVTLASLQAALEGFITNEMYESLKRQVNDLEASVDSLQEQVNVNTVKLAELELEDPIIEYQDPCGNGPGFDEIIMKTRSGKLIVYFESGSKRFLIILVPGSYRTTDQQQCRFDVNAIGHIINERI